MLHPIDVMLDVSVQGVNGHDIARARGLICTFNVRLRETRLSLPRDVVLHGMIGGKDRL